MMTQDSPVSFAVSVSRLPARGMQVKIEADEEARERLAAIHGLADVRSFHAELNVAPWRRDGVKVTGRVDARIVQNCIVTLEPLDAQVAAAIDAVFLPEGSPLARPDRIEGGELLLDAEGDDGPEMFSGDTVDVGALAEEFFALDLDPYPRKAGVEETPEPAAEEEKRGPLYEKLKALREGS